MLSVNEFLTFRPIGIVKTTKFVKYFDILQMSELVVDFVIEIWNKRATTQKRVQKEVDAFSLIFKIIISFCWVSHLWMMETTKRTANSVERRI